MSYYSTALRHFALTLYYIICVGHKGLNVGYKSVQQIASHKTSRIAALLRAFVKGQRAMAPTRRKLTRRWLITPRGDKETWSADTLAEWLRTAYAATDCLSPEGFRWTSHNLRKRGASAAHAILARLTDTRFAGGRGTTSNVFEAKYIDFTMHLSPVAWLFSVFFEGHPH